MKPIINQLKDVSGNNISDLNADWESAPINVADCLHFAAQLGWDDVAVQGSLELQYSCDPKASPADIAIWSTVSTVALNGTFQEQMFIDSNLAVGNLRLKFTHTSGTANLTTYVVRR